MRGQSRQLSIVRAAQVLEAVGMELSAKAFPVGVPVRDAGQLALLGRLRARINSELVRTNEVPVIEPLVMT